MRHITLIVTLFLSVTFIGCGVKNALPTIVVKGAVKLDGVPAEGVNVTFNPSSGEGIAAGGITGKDGTYTLTAGANTAGSGALAGEYIPTFSKFEMEYREPAASQEEEVQKYGTDPPKRIYIVPQKYDDVKTCGVSAVKVEKGGKNVFDFELKTE